MLTLFIKDSNNRKTGHVAVSYTHKDSCPDTCNLKGNGCYAEGHPTSIHWNSIGRVKNGGSPKSQYDWEDFCRQVGALPKHKVFRHNIAGDLPGYEGDNNSIDIEKVKLLSDSCSRIKAFTFTHKPIGNSEPTDTESLRMNRKLNAEVIKKINEEGNITINISSENLSKADEAMSLNIGPVVTVVGLNAPRHMKTPEGRHVIVCPNEDDKNRTCDRCMLCANAKRKAIIAFRAHGVKKNAVSKRAEFYHDKLIQLRKKNENVLV